MTKPLHHEASFDKAPALTTIELASIAGGWVPIASVSDIGARVERTYNCAQANHTLSGALSGNAMCSGAGFASYPALVTSKPF